MTAVRFHLAIDDGGELFVVAGPRVVIGHLRSRSADLPFLADIELEHAILTLADSFHGGPTWWIRRGEEVPVPLADGELVELAANLAFVFHAPDPSSSSAVLDLRAGAECEGARRVLLLAPGAAGRVRIGRAPARHVQIADLVQDVTLELEGANLRIGGATIPCPPAQLVALPVPARGPGKPPLGLTLWPVSMDAPARA